METDFVASAEPTDGATRPVVRAIYHRFVSHCQPFSLGDDWERFPDPHAFQFRGAPSVLLQSLQSEFTNADLRSAGVVKDSGDRPRLNELVSGPIVALRQRTEDSPFDLLTPMGSLVGRAPLVSAMDDVLALDRKSEHAPEVHAVPTMADVIALRGLGMCAAPFAGLATLSREALEEFFARWHSGRNPLPSDCQERHRRDWVMFLYAWSPSTYRAAPEAFAGADAAYEADVARIREHLSAVRKWLGRDMPRAYVCRRPQGIGERLAFALQHGGRDDIYRVIDENCLRPAEPLIALPCGINRIFAPPADYAGASAHLHEVHAWRGDKGVKIRAMQNWEDTVERDLIEPARRAALAEPDVVQRNLKIAFADGAGLAHRTRVAVEAKLSAATAASETGTKVDFPVEELRAYVRLNETLLKTARQIQRWPKPTLPKMSSDLASPNPAAASPTLCGSSPSNASKEEDCSGSTSLLTIFDP